MRKLTYSHVKEKFFERGYVLLSNNYVNNKYKMSCICSNGHNIEISYSDFSQGKGCRICGHKRGGRLRRNSYDEINKAFKKEGYKLITKSYSNCEQVLYYECPYGHRHSITWHNWASGYRCPKCYYKEMSINQTGPLSHFWQGGVSTEPYCDAWADKEYKESIKERDKYKCSNPCCYDEDTILSVHHIDYNKKNCKPSNLITVCRRCNSAANFDRDWHKSWYTAIVQRRI